jgi:polyhydroxyalkanoate synthase subunit PhaE
MAPWIGTVSNSKDQSTGFPGASPWLSDPTAFFERMIWFPPFSVIQGTAGPAVQNYSKYSEIAKSSIQLYQKWLDLYLEFSKALTDVSAKLNARLFTSGATSDPKQAYVIWLEEFTQGMDKLLRDESVASRMASFLSNMLDLKRESDAFMENYYKMMNIPTRSEMDRVYKEIYSLKKELRNLRRSGIQNGGANE